VALIGGAPLAQTNGSFNALAVNALNALLGGIEKPGGILFTPELPLSAPGSASAPTTPQGSYSQVTGLVQQIVAGSRAPKVLLLFDANPVFAAPNGADIGAVLEKIPFIASFGSFINETSSLADLILPDHSPLESWLDGVPESGSAQAVVNLAPPAVRPLHSTRAMADVLLDVAHQLGGETAQALPWKNSEEMLHSAYAGLRNQKRSVEAGESEDDFWDALEEQGGWWSAEIKSPPPKPISREPSQTIPSVDGRSVEAEFDGPENQYPFHFLPFASPMLYDGSLAHLPWMQEVPDVLSTAMWSSWVEINPKTAERLGIKQGDLVEVASQHGTVRAPAVLTPGIAPDVIAMPVGQGHENFTRYASGRGANPIAILAPKTDAETGALAWAATRVKISRVGEGKLALFGGGMSGFPHEAVQR